MAAEALAVPIVINVAVDVVATSPVLSQLQHFAIGFASGKPVQRLICTAANPYIIPVDKRTRHPQEAAH